MNQVAVDMRGIVKQFPGVLANDHVDFSVRAGEIHALVGENGAGKSSLMNILYGLIKPDSGEIQIDGKPVSLQGPRDAIRAGIGMVHQHFMLIPPLTVAENIMLGDESLRAATKPLGRLALPDRERPAKHIAELSAQYSLEDAPERYVRELPGGRTPEHVSLSPDGKYAALVLANGAATSKLDAKYAAVTGILKVLAVWPVALHPAPRAPRLGGGLGVRLGSRGVLPGSGCRWLRGHVAPPSGRRQPGSISRIRDIRPMRGAAMDGHSITMLGTGLIGDFYTNTLQGQRGRDRVHVVYSRSAERGLAFRDR